MGKAASDPSEALQEVAEAERDELQSLVIPTPGRIVLVNIGIIPEVVWRPAIVIDVVGPGGEENRGNVLEVHLFLTPADFPLPAAVRLNDGGRGAVTMFTNAADDPENVMCGEWVWPTITAAPLVTSDA